MGLLGLGYGYTRTWVYALLALLAIGGTVLMFIFIVPEKKREKLNPFGKLLHDTFNFKYLVIEKILQALYIFITFYVVLTGFLGMFDDFLSGLLTMVLGPILIRLAYEGVMMAILLVKNVIQINNKLRHPEDGDAPSKDIFGIPTVEASPVVPEAAAPIAPQEMAAKHFCNNCGAKVSEGALFCPECGNKL